ncbi:hypothetical protein DH2020_027174 [Rehmannia glutinosa]|uniref:Potassium transporter n=1 Tax=Rehmannia glutinosa TaxID=99300 RepID=A0ABR0VV14_REHGL
MEEEGHHPTTTSNTTAAASGDGKETNMKERKVSWAKLRRVDSLNMEAGNISSKPTHHASRGTFALYSLICRYAKVSFIPNDQPEDRELSNYRLDTPSNQLRRAQKIKEKIEKSKTAKLVLFLATILGTAMVIGDGVLTPCISDAVVFISIAILITLFCVQRFGTDKVGYSFAPAVCLWFLFISGIGLYNLFKHDVTVLRAFNPKYIIDYFRRNGKKGWISLGGVVLCITDPLYWPTFVVANAAAIIASQAMISGAFAIVSQSLSLRCFPRVKVVHTSAKYEGQVYIPEVNYLLMIACVVVTYGFKTTEKIGHAYGKSNFTQGGYLPLALSLVLMIMMGIWHYAHQQRYIFELKNKVSSVYITDLVKNENINRLPGIGLLYSELVQGIPPIFPHFISNIPSIHSVVVFVSIKSIPISKVAVEERFLFRQVEPRDYRLFRCVVRYGYKDLIEEPKEFERQLVENLKEFIRHEHFILDEQMPEIANVPHSGLLVSDGKTRKSSASAVHIEETLKQQIPTRVSSSSIQSFNAARSENTSNRIGAVPVQGVEEELQFVETAKEQGVFYLIGEAEVVAKQESSLLKKFVINYAYSFLRKNFREGEKVLAIPRNRLLRVWAFETFPAVCRFFKTERTEQRLPRMCGWRSTSNFGIEEIIAILDEPMDDVLFQLTPTQEETEKEYIVIFLGVFPEDLSYPLDGQAVPTDRDELTDPREMVEETGRERDRVYKCATRGSP